MYLGAFAAALKPGHNRPIASHLSTSPSEHRSRPRPTLIDAFAELRSDEDGSVNEEANGASCRNLPTRLISIIAALQVWIMTSSSFVIRISATRWTSFTCIAYFSFLYETYARS